MSAPPVAVVGAGGLIGSAVAEHLGRDRRVIRVGRGAAMDVPLDLAAPHDGLAGALRGIEDVVHCAGVTDEAFAADAAGAWRRATLATQQLAVLLRRAGVRRLVYVSTAHVYGPLAGPLSERTPPDPRSDYALAHYASEQILRRHGFAGALLRPCAVFGQPVDLARFGRWSLVPFGFPRMARDTGVVRLATPGHQRRNFVAATEIAAAAAEALAEAGPMRVVNPVGGDDMTVRDFAMLVAAQATRVLGRPCRVEAPDGAVDGAPLIYLSETRAAAPQGGLARFVEAFINRLEQEDRNEDCQRRRASA